jgi:hypothetical protein
MKLKLLKNDFVNVGERFMIMIIFPPIGHYVKKFKNHVLSKIFNQLNV